MVQAKEKELLEQVTILHLPLYIVQCKLDSINYNILIFLNIFLTLRFSKIFVQLLARKSGSDVNVSELKQYVQVSWSIFFNFTNRFRIIVSSTKVVVH